MVLDLTNRNATLANDLLLREEDGRLLLRGADVSPWAVVRRLSRGLLARGSDRHLLDWKNLEFLRGDPGAARTGGDYHRRVTRLQPAEIAHLAEALPYLHATELLSLIPDPLAADALEVMQPEQQLQVVENNNDFPWGLLGLLGLAGLAGLRRHPEPVRHEPGRVTPTVGMYESKK